MPITRDEVIRGYRIMFGRQPESEGVITDKLFHDNIESLCSELLMSEEMSSILHGSRSESPAMLGPHGARQIVVKELVLAPRAQAAILVAHAPAGRLKPHVLPYLKLLHASGLEVLLVVAVDRPLELRDEEVAAAQGIIVRDNVGYDFGAWAHGLRLHPELFGASLLILANDSVVPTANAAVFRTMIDRVRDSTADVIGLTSSHEYGWHVQSYFLGLKPRALSSWGFQHFIREIRPVRDKDEVVRTYEVPFAETMQRAGLVVAAIFTGPLAANPTFFSWRDLIEQGFPFIKLLMLRKQFAAVADWPEVLKDIHDNWPAVLGHAGFDVDLVRAAIAAADIASVPSGHGTGLLVNGQQLAPSPAGQPPRVAYFGPWNYESVGEASRAMLCSLRYARLRLNAYPVMKPIHAYRLICPAVETVDFGARPDVAIVHLDPDSWHLLTDDQLAVIHSAKRRVGVGDADSPPAPWSRDLPSIGRMWAPIQDRADAFAAQAGVPVDLVLLPVSTDIAGAAAYRAVAETLENSIASLLAEADDASRLRPPRPTVIVPPAPLLAIDFSGAPSFSELAPADGVVPVPLAADLSWTGAALPDGESSDWLVFAPGNAYICPGAFELILKAASLRPEVVLFYADDVAAAGDMVDRIRLKPDFDRTLFVAQDYIGAPVIVRRKNLLDVGGLDPIRGSAVLYDLVLRIADAGGPISRIARVLIGSEHERPIADLVERRLALTASAAMQDVDLIAAAVPDQLLQRRRFAVGACPAVTIVIPTCRSVHASSNATYVERLLHAVAGVKWPLAQLTVIVGDDIVEPPDWAQQPWPFQFKWIATPRASDEPFNYAVKMNRLWQEATDEHIVFMNDDVLPHGADWLTALVGFTSDQSVGGVGPRLYYEDGSIQHAGMFPSFDTVVHAWLGWPADAKTYQDWAKTQREWSMLTGAVFATRRSLLEQLNGFDERFSLEFNDVDLCLRIRSLGYRIVFNPDAEFTHAEKASRGNAIPPGTDVALFLSRWSPWLDNDPASHPGFDHQRVDPVPVAAADAWYLHTRKVDNVAPGRVAHAKNRLGRFTIISWALRMVRKRIRVVISRTQ